MRSVPFDFEGSTYALSFTAEALFEFQEKYGDTTDLIGETRAMENTVEGWKGCCWLGALLARQGELQRRYMGETPQPMLSAEELRRKASPRDMLRLRKAIQEALLLGFSRAVDEDEDEEVDTVLAERERAEKKTRALVRSALDGLVSALGSLVSASGRSSS